jgi:hypothetical protein
MRLFTIPTTVVKNFSPGYPAIKRMWANFCYMFFGIILFPRKNLLTKKDFSLFRSNIRKGDVLLVGNLQSLFSKTLKDPITHSALVVDPRTVIHATCANGVEKKPFKEMLATYDTMVLMRIPCCKGRSSYISKAVSYAEKSLGKPYNFSFQVTDDSVYCSALVNDALLAGGYDTGLKTSKGRYVIPGVKGPLSAILSMIKPGDFVRGNLSVVCTSHNIAVKNEKILFTEDISRINAFIKGFIQDNRLKKTVEKRFKALLATRKSLHEKLFQ